MSAPVKFDDRCASHSREMSLRRCLSTIIASDRDVEANHRVRESQRRRHQKDSPRTSETRDGRDARDGSTYPEKLPTLPFVGWRGNSRGPAKKFHKRYSPAADDQKCEERRCRSKGFRSDYALGEALRTPNDTIVHASSQVALAAVESLKEHDFAFIKRSDGSFTYSILAYRSFEPVKGSSCEEECMTFVMSHIGSIKRVRRRHWARCVSLATAEGHGSISRLVSLSSCENGRAAPEDDPLVFSRISKGKDPNSQDSNSQDSKCMVDPPSAKHGLAVMEAGKLVQCQEFSPRQPVLHWDTAAYEDDAYGDDAYGDDDEDLLLRSTISFMPHAVTDEECSLISSVSDRARAMRRRRTSG